MIETGHADAIAALQAARADPVRLRLVEALARRAAGYRGEARRRLDARLAELIAGLQAPVAAPPAPTGATAARPPGPLAALAAVRPRTPPTAPGARTAGPAPWPTAAPDEPVALSHMRATWARLSAEQRLAQSRARLPDNAGPLNSQHLIHRSLALMHQLSPACLQHFLAQMDGLMWLDQVNHGKMP